MKKKKKKKHKKKTQYNVCKFKAQIVAGAEQ